jgi:hypothetical protein
MRTFGIIMATLVVVLLVGFGAYWAGNGGLAIHDEIIASITGDGDLEVAALHERKVAIESVRFNDRCTVDRFKWYDRSKPWYNGGWVITETSSTGPISLREGDLVYALYDQRACGVRILKAEVATSAGIYVFRYPLDTSRAPRPDRFPLVLDRWFDLR